MTTAIDRIRSKNKPVAKIESTPSAISSATRSPTVADNTSPNLTRETPEAADDQRRPKLPPPIPCPLCDCPAIWSSIYEPNTFRCCDCDPPPGGWHWQKGGWRFVAKRAQIVSGEWESLQRLDTGLSVHPSSRTTQRPTAIASTQPGGIIYLPMITLSPERIGGLTGRGFSGKPTPSVPPEIIDTRRRCKNCKSRYILPELRGMTGEQCWTCWSLNCGSSAAA